MIFGKSRKVADFKDLFAPSEKTKEDDLLGYDFGQIQRRVKDVTRNYDVADSISTIYVEYIGSCGNILKASDAMEKIWSDWGKSCTLRGDNWATARSIRIKEGVDSGGCLVLFGYDSDDKFKISFVQGGSVANPPKVGQGEMDSHGFKVFNGICYDSTGLEVGYHYCNGGKWFYTDRKNSLGEYIAYFERSALPMSAQQTRTFPLITSTLIKIEDRQLLWDYVFTASRNSAAIGVVMTTDDPQGLQSGMGVVNDDGSTDEVIARANATQISGDVQPNMLIVAPMKTQVQTTNPQGNFAYDILLKRMNQEIGASVGIPEAILFKDTTGNFASSKFSAQPFIKTMRVWGSHYNVLDEIILRRLLLEANLDGEFTEDIGQFSWLGDVNFNDVDSSKSASGSMKLIEAGKSTRTIEAGKDQIDFKDIATQSAKEVETLKKVATEHNIDYKDLINHMGYNIEEEVQDDGE